MNHPHSISAGETLSGGMQVLLTPAGEWFKKMCRVLHAHLQPKIVNLYRPTLMHSTKQNIFDIFNHPKRHQNHAKQYTVAVVMALLCGTVLLSYEDPDVQAVNYCLTHLGVTIYPGV
ncbi:hypothetical protein AX16_010024 [Volvariella volvacea WC 439]|nr:hypothetical protein AX16_010024 [Volvariella volvacea WC 439]